MPEHHLLGNCLYLVTEMNRAMVITLHFFALQNILREITKLVAYQFCGTQEYFQRFDGLNNSTRH
jgi:hypothetical protein